MSSMLLLVVVVFLSCAWLPRGRFFCNSYHEFLEEIQICFHKQAEIQICKWQLSLAINEEDLTRLALGDNPFFT